MGLHPYAVDFLALSIKVCGDTGAQSGRWQVAVGSGSGRRKSRQEQSDKTEGGAGAASQKA